MSFGPTKRFGRLNLIGDRQGVVALEFALIAPFILVLLFGLFEVSSLVRASLKLSHAANNLAKIVAQQQPAPPAATPVITKAQLIDACKGAGYVLTPFPSGSLSAAIVSVSSSKGGLAVADWEDDAACPSSSGSYGAVATSAAGSGGYDLTPNAGDSVIVVHMNYTYVPVLHYVLGSTWTLSQVAYSRPRAGGTIACSDCS